MPCALCRTPGRLAAARSAASYRDIPRTKAAVKAARQPRQHAGTGARACGFAVRAGAGLTAVPDAAADAAVTAAAETSCGTPQCRSTRSGQCQRQNHHQLSSFGFNITATRLRHPMHHRRT